MNDQMKVTCKARRCTQWNWLEITSPKTGVTKTVTGKKVANDDILQQMAYRVTDACYAQGKSESSIVEVEFTINELVRFNEATK